MFMLISGLIAVLSGIYFLFLPIGGYMGGRNPFYDVIIFFQRHTWDDIHTWSSVARMALALLHIPLHWDWIVKMTQKGFRSVAGKEQNSYESSRFNLLINVLIGISGLICGLSGLYFLFLPADPILPIHPPGLGLDPYLEWVVMTAAGILHFRNSLEVGGKGIE